MVSKLWLGCILWSLIQLLFTTTSLSKLPQGVAVLYSETCVNGHLYSETTCIKRPLCDVPKESV